MTVNSRVIKTFLAWIPDALNVPLTNGLHIQIVTNIQDLPQARKHQCAAFVASEALLIVWDDSASNIMSRAIAIEAELMQLVWETGEPGGNEEEINEKMNVAVSSDMEPGHITSEDRPTHLMNTILVAFTLIIVVVLLGLACRSLAIEMAVDKEYLRLAFLALIPIQVFFTLVSRVYILSHQS